MATMTYAQLQTQIANLQAQAEQLKSEEVTGVIAKIKDAIASYGLTAADLFGNRMSLKGKQSKAGSKASQSTQAKYADGRGGEWVGRGPRPQWLREALQNGKTLDDFAVGATRAAPSKRATPFSVRKGGAAKPSTASKKAGKPKYADGNGNSWSGFGRQPKWMTDALASGKSMDDLRPQD